MYCPKCGKLISDTAKFCNYCGERIADENDYYSDNQPQEDPYLNGYYTDDISANGIDGSNEAGKKWIIQKETYKYLAMAGLIIIVAVAGLINRDNHKNPPTEDTVIAGNAENSVESTESTVNDSEDQSVETATEYKETEEVEDNDEVASQDDVDAQNENDDIYIPYTDNLSCAINNNLSKEAFQYQACPEGGFSFIYPKYLFNKVTYNPSRCEYQFSYENDGEIFCRMNVYKEEAKNSDPVSAAKNFRRRFDGLLDEARYWWPSPDLEKLTSDPDSEYREPRGDGYARYIMSGWRDYGKSELLYVMGANDGLYNYYLEFIYPEFDVKSDVENWDYVVECVYRGCSFSGTSYDLRSWEQFKSEGYGEGHH